MWIMHSTIFPIHITIFILTFVSTTLKNTMYSGKGNMFGDFIIVGFEAFYKLIRSSVEGLKIEHNINNLCFFTGKLYF